MTQTNEPQATCLKCGKPCEVHSREYYDIEEFWGAPVKRYYWEDESLCCGAEVEFADPWEGVEWKVE